MTTVKAPVKVAHHGRRINTDYSAVADYEGKLTNTLPDFDEVETRLKFRSRFPNLTTVVVNCFDPRAVGTFAAVAREVPGSIYPGEILREGDDVISTSTIFPIINAGGHAQPDGMRSIAIAKYFFDIKNVIVVHHSMCGAFTFTPEGFYRNFKEEYGKDPSTVVRPEDLGCYENITESLKSNVRHVRFSQGTPDDMNIYGCFYDIQKDDLMFVVSDEGTPTASGRPIS
jgi:carbonic anhydrase